MSSKQGLLGHLDPVGAEAFHILLVEDDELTLKVTEGLLRKCDYQGRTLSAPHGFDVAEQTLSNALIAAVTLARNGREALQALQSPEGEHINLILTDVLMPEVGGNLSDFHPFDACFVFVSAHVHIMIVGLTSHVFVSALSSLNKGVVWQVPVSALHSQPSLTG